MNARLVIGTCAAVACLVLACKGGADAMVKAQEDFANKVCACSDMDCIKKVQTEQEEWVKKNGSAAVGGNESDQEKMTASAKKMSDCITKIATKH